MLRVVNLEVLHFQPQAGFRELHLKDMRRLASSSRGLSIATICQPSASRSYATRGNNEGTRSTTSKIKDGSLDADLDNLSGFNYGFDNWSEINKSRKTIKTAAGSLPISPLLDPAWREARQRKKKKIPQKEAKHNRFQRRMMENPFGEHLAPQNRGSPGKSRCLAAHIDI